MADNPLSPAVSIPLQALHAGGLGQVLLSELDPDNLDRAFGLCDPSFDLYLGSPTGPLLLGES